MSRSRASDAEDVAQEAFVRAFVHVRTFDAPRPLSPWLLASDKIALAGTMGDGLGGLITGLAGNKAKPNMVYQEFEGGLIYDPLLSGGQNNYTPGMLVSSALLNANLQTHKVTLTAKPADVMGFTLEYSLHRANELNNRGAIGPMQVLQSKEVAQELDFFCSVFIGKNYFFQQLLAAAIPGSAIKQAVGGTADNWYAVQASLYWFF